MGEEGIFQGCTKLSENLHHKHDELGCWKFLLMCDWFAVCAGVGVCVCV